MDARALGLPAPLSLPSLPTDKDTPSQSLPSPQGATLLHSVGPHFLPHLFLPPPFKAFSPPTSVGNLLERLWKGQANSQVKWANLEVGSQVPRSVCTPWPAGVPEFSLRKTYSLC